MSTAKPQPIPVVKVAAAGTKQLLYNGPLFVREATIQASPANTNNVYIGDETLNKTTLVGVIAILKPGEKLDLVKRTGPVINLGEFFVDADTNDNAVVGYYNVL